MRTRRARQRILVCMNTLILLTALAVPVVFFVPVAAMFLLQAADALDPVQLITGFFEAVQAGKVADWVAGAGVVAAVVGIRKYGGKIPKIGPYLETHPLVGLALPFLGACAWGFVQALVTHHPVGEALAAGATVAAKAITLYIGYKKVTETRELAKAKAAEIDTEEEALDALDKGP